MVATVLHLQPQMNQTREQPTPVVVEVDAQKNHHLEQVEAVTEDQAWLYFAIQALNQ